MSSVLEAAISELNLEAGVEIYENPDPYETCTETVRRIFVAIIKAALVSTPPSDFTNCLKKGFGELPRVLIGDCLPGPCDNHMFDRTNFDEKRAGTGSGSPVPHGRMLGEVATHDMNIEFTDNEGRRLRIGECRTTVNRPGIFGGSNSEVNWSHDEQDNEQIQP